MEKDWEVDKGENEADRVAAAWAVLWQPVQQATVCVRNAGAKNRMNAESPALRKIAQRAGQG